MKNESVLLYQTRNKAFRDATAYIYKGEVYLFFTTVEYAPEGRFFYVSMCKSHDFEHWSEPQRLTEKDVSLNYSSPGNVIEYNGEYYLCLQTYPCPNGEAVGNETCRIFTMKTTDFIHWTKPEMLRVKGDIPECEMGRMIDPYIIWDEDRFVCFYKQNGVTFSTSKDLKHWEYLGNCPCGENVCVIKDQGEYLIFNSPANGRELHPEVDNNPLQDPGNGINLIISPDLKHFRSVETFYLDQLEKPWAKDRITAGFVLDISELELGWKYAMIYHGDDHATMDFGASLAVKFGNDLRKW